MEIEINSARTIKEIQDEFNHKFPFLALHFFNVKSVATELFSKQNKIEDVNQLLGDVYVMAKDGVVNVNGHMKVDTLENQFLDEFQIPVQLYRKSGNLWLQTVETNEWSLAEQNRHGEEMDQNIIESNQEFDQFREQE